MMSDGDNRLVTARSTGIVHDKVTLSMFPARREIVPASDHPWQRRWWMVSPGPRRTMLLALACAVLVTGQARAAEHITLRNGFELDCDHRGVSDAAVETVGMTAAASSGTAGKVRLYLDASEANYLDVGRDEIVAAETLAPVLAAAGVTPAPAATKAELSATELRELLANAGAEHDLDVDLLASLVRAESGSHVRAVSRVGAQGLMQLMPATAAQLGVKDSFVPEANVHGGTAYLDSLLKRYHDNLALALAAYNAGPAAVDRYRGVPPYRETRAYVARIIHEFNRRYAARQAAASLAMAR